MTDDIVVNAAEKFYDDLRDKPCILCGEPQSYVLGSYTPEQKKNSRNEKYKTPFLYYTLCKQCFNNGSILTARIEGAYRDKFRKKAA